MKERRTFLKHLGLSAIGVTVLPHVKLNAQTAPNLKHRTCDPTTLDYFGQGPFYTPDAPLIDNEVLVEDSEPGERLIINGAVYASDCTTPIPNALLDVWHANDAGEYDNEGYNLRGKVYTDSNGFYRYETILPGKYLNGQIFRPRHIHLKVSASGFTELTTQLYFEGDAELGIDAAASISQGTFDATDRIIALTENESNQKLEGVFDVILNESGVGVPEQVLHINRGLITNCYPNPMRTEGTVAFSVFQEAEISLTLYSTEGKLVGVLMEDKMPAGKYSVSWGVQSLNIAPGSYLLVMSTDGLQIHHQRISIV